MTWHDHLNETLVPVAEALRIVLAEATPLGSEVAILDEALGRVLAEDVVSPADLPACDRSAMDGYAIQAADLATLPADLEVTGFVPAGKSAAGLQVDRGQAIRIMTGAPIPSGADAVQMIERTEDLDGGARVRVLAPVRAGENIFHQGDDLKGGSVVLRAGAWIRPAELGALAAVGQMRFLVRRRPLVQILSTGDEVVPPEHEALPHQVRNSNGPTLMGAMRQAGLDPASLGVARDDPEDLDQKIATGLKGDLFILIGGVSVGDRDLVAERLQAAGVQVLFHRVAMKPGKPLLFGRRGGCLVFGLPGNPLSSFTDFFVFALPAIQKLSGLTRVGLPEVRVRIAEPIRHRPGRTWYRLARISIEDGLFIAQSVPSTGSGDLVSAARANGFLIVPANTSLLDAGAQARALLWPGFEIS